MSSMSAVESSIPAHPVSRAVFNGQSYPVGNLLSFGKRFAFLPKDWHHKIGIPWDQVMRGSGDDGSGRIPVDTNTCGIRCVDGYLTVKGDRVVYFGIGLDSDRNKCNLSDVEVGYML